MRARRSMARHGYRRMKSLDVLCGAVPGTLIRDFAVLRLASSIPPATATTLSVFELSVRCPGLRNPLPSYSLTLFSIFFTLLYWRAALDLIFIMSNLPIIQKTYNLRFSCHFLSQLSGQLICPLPHQSHPAIPQIYPPFL
jgi:hypothetical protein